jgi:hypothetical protein
MFPLPVGSEPFGDVVVLEQVDGLAKSDQRRAAEMVGQRTAKRVTHRGTRYPRRRAFVSVVRSWMPQPGTVCPRVRGFTTSEPKLRSRPKTCQRRVCPAALPFTTPTPARARRLAGPTRHRASRSVRSHTSRYENSHGSLPLRSHVCWLERIICSPGRIDPAEEVQNPGAQREDMHHHVDELVKSFHRTFGC